MPAFSRLAVALQLSTVFLSPVLGAAAGQQYDYVIVGGGVTGLVVANRLSEDKSKTVLVIEAGDNVDTDGTRIPYKANDLTAAAGLYWDGIKSLPEPAIGNGSFDVFVAKVLGGGSVVNGMIYDRGSAGDYDCWAALGNDDWDWKGLLPYFIKGTTLQPPTPEAAKKFNITWDESVYGNGPLPVSITSNQYKDITSYFAAWKASGVHIPQDGNNGEAIGPSWFPNTMDVKTGRRAHAVYAYYDTIKATRPNLHIITGTTVNKINFDTSCKTPKAIGVETTDKTGKCQIFNAKKEVVLAAGTIATPKLLQLSGVGPESVMKPAGIRTVVALDAVGTNFQDHPYATLIFNTTNQFFPDQNSLATNVTFNATAWKQYQETKTGPYTYARGNSLAFVPLPDMTNDTESLTKSLNSQRSTDYLPNIYKINKKLTRGFAKQAKFIAESFGRKDIAAAELTCAADGTYVLAAVEKPLSRGTVHINPKNPRGPPIVTYNALMNPIDRRVLFTSVRFFRTIWASPLLARYKITEKVPGAQFKTDEELYTALIKQKMLAPSLAHPCGSCPMMPREDGGCVSDKLLVYGTQHLSIVDASIIPIIPGAHTQATAYAIAEKAADIIKAR
ncbi:Choline dehydrogenase [Pyrenophora tritici-repentis]|nr:Choline dehydrogenase [Pyrenophora tritici-repentis]